MSDQQKFTLHLPKTSRPTVSMVAECSARDSKKAIGLGTESEVENRACPECGKITLARCMVQEEYAIVMCTDKKCVYPFGEQSLDQYIIHVSREDLLKSAMERMVRAGVDQNTARQIARAS
ncbi:hypothetical protein V1511DRAFT_514748 [Dipodascopsis uninucleata]